MPGGGAAELGVMMMAMKISSDGRTYPCLEALLDKPRNQEAGHTDQELSRLALGI